MEANKDYVSAVLELRQLQMGYPVKWLGASLKTKKMRKRRGKLLVNLGLYAVRAIDVNLKKMSLRH